MVKNNIKKDSKLQLSWGHNVKNCRYHVSNYDYRISSSFCIILSQINLRF